MPSRIIIILCNLIEPLLHVMVRHRKFCGIYYASLECLDNVSCCEKLSTDANALHHRCAQPEEAHFQTSEIIDGVYRPLEPSSAFGACHAARKRLGPVLTV